MATTTNFGWETPDDTDLVKDGAAAMRTLGGAIDTSLVDLKGGTTGQILSKASNTDMDFSWITNDPPFVGCSAYKNTTSQTLTNATLTAITFDNEYFDTDGFHSNTTNTSRFTVPSGKAGKYLITCNITYSGNSTGVRGIYFYKNGVVFNNNATYSSVHSFAFNVNGSCVMDLAVSDYVEVYGYQNSGGNLNVTGGSTPPDSQFQFIYLGA